PSPSSMVSHPPGPPSPISAIAAGQSSSTSRSRREKPRLQLAPDQPLTTQGKPRARVYVACVQWSASAVATGSGQDIKPLARIELPAEPSMKFAREIWWDVLLGHYAWSVEQSHGSATFLAPGARESANQQVTSDLRFFFRCSLHWLAFMNPSRLLRQLQDPAMRATLQPSYVWAALALATFFQSSDLESAQGARGRERALRMRDEAQSALEASLAARWIDNGLAQASWLLAFFETCAHPVHSTARVSAAMSTLDSVIRYLSLTTLDADDPRVTRFAQRPPVAGVTGPEPGNEGRTLQGASPQQSLLQSVQQRHPQDRCWCSFYTLERTSPNSVELVPGWSHTLAVTTLTDAEERREESRRLVWSSISLTANWTAYNAATLTPQINLPIIDPANYAILFPGESTWAAGGPAAKDSVWALSMRSLMLWHTCVHMRNDVNMNNALRAHLSRAVWQEICVIEDALDGHTCNIERTFLFFPRDFLFLSRLCIIDGLQRHALHAEIDKNVVRQKTEEWLRHHGTMARRIMNGLHTVTGQPSTSLSVRPFLTWWFIAQVSRMLNLWSNDGSLTIALQSIKSIFAPLEYLMALWPCDEANRRFQDLRKRVRAVCHAAGVRPPMP
ncbi:hypothetical protein POSPLADRAFT_1095578, partial [Postia placenta MAD-698-R-SB12]